MADSKDAANTGKGNEPDLTVKGGSSVNVILSDGHGIRVVFENPDGSKNEAFVEVPKGEEKLPAGKTAQDPSEKEVAKANSSESQPPKPIVEAKPEPALIEEKARLEAEAKKEAERLKAFRDSISEAQSRTEATFKKGHSLGVWSVVFGFLLAAITVWICWFLFVCSDCRNNTQKVEVVKDASVSEPVSENNVSSQNLKPDYIYESNSHQVSQETLVAEEPLATFGEFMPADPQLVLDFVAYFSGPDSINFRFYGADSLDGENKYLFQALGMATLVASKKAVGWVERDGVESWEVFPFSYTPYNTISTVSRMARLVGEKAEYNAVYRNDESIYWWLNGVIEPIPSSTETDWSRAVKETKDRFMEEKVRKGKIPSVNSVTFAVNYTPSKSRPGSTAKKKRVNSNSSGVKTKSSNLLSPLNMVKASYASLGYISPIPSGYSYIDGGVFGTLRTRKDGTTYYHAAEDLSAPQGSRIVQPAPFVGTVVSAKWEGGFGNCVRLDIGDAEIIFAHLQFFGPKIKIGAKISQGMEIGKVGSTGESTGPHLHIEFVPKVPNFIVPIFIQEETAGAYSSGLSRLKNKTYKTKKPQKGFFL
jgi:murein DD-endopeptidase MepM/ murein hydrolase activator NlpD